MAIGGTSTANGQPVEIAAVHPDSAGPGPVDSYTGQLGVENKFHLPDTVKIPDGAFSNVLHGQIGERPGRTGIIGNVGEAAQYTFANYDDNSDGQGTPVSITRSTVHYKDGTSQEVYLIAVSGLEDGNPEADLGDAVASGLELRNNDLHRLLDAAAERYVPPDAKVFVTSHSAGANTAQAWATDDHDFDIIGIVAFGTGVVGASNLSDQRNAPVARYVATGDHVAGLTLPAQTDGTIRNQLGHNIRTDPDRTSFPEAHFAYSNEDPDVFGIDLPFDIERIELTGERAFFTYEDIGAEPGNWELATASWQARDALSPDRDIFAYRSMRIPADQLASFSHEELTAAMLNVFNPQRNTFTRQDQQAYLEKQLARTPFNARRVRNRIATRQFDQFDFGNDKVSFPATAGPGQIVGDSYGYTSLVDNTFKIIAQVPIDQNSAVVMFSDTPEFSYMAEVALLQQPDPDSIEFRLSHGGPSNVDEFEKVESVYAYIINDKQALVEAFQAEREAFLAEPARDGQPDNDRVVGELFQRLAAEGVLTVDEAATLVQRFDSLLARMNSGRIPFASDQLETVRAARTHVEELAQYLGDKRVQTYLVDAEKQLDHYLGDELNYVRRENSYGPTAGPASREQLREIERLANEIRDKIREYRERVGDLDDTVSHTPQQLAQLAA